MLKNSMFLLWCVKKYFVYVFSECLFARQLFLNAHSMCSLNKPLCFLVFAESRTTNHEEAGSLQHCQTTIFLLLQRREGTAFFSSFSFLFLYLFLPEKSNMPNKFYVAIFTLVYHKKWSSLFLGMTNIETLVIWMFQR